MFMSKRIFYLKTQTKENDHFILKIGLIFSFDGNFFFFQIIMMLNKYKCNQYGPYLISLKRLV